MRRRKKLTVVDVKKEIIKTLHLDYGLTKEEATKALQKYSNIPEVKLLINNMSKEQGYFTSALMGRACDIIYDKFMGSK